MNGGLAFQKGVRVNSVFYGCRQIGRPRYFRPAKTAAFQMKQSFLALSFLFVVSLVEAQTNVRAWYADGQVWVVWQFEAPLPETYAIFAKPTSFTSTDNATQVGRLFREEYLPSALKEQVDTALTYKIPNATGGSYQLKSDEALFVFTPHQAGQLFFAVKKWGETAVSAQNITPNAVPFQYDPAGDPVECHLQKTFVSPFDPGYLCFAFYSWADGRQNQWENRPDFPVMANAAKNGMPSFFMVSAPMGLDTTGGIPLTVWLHGGGGRARESLAGSRLDVRLNPKKGILLAHNDDLFGYLLTFYLTGDESVSKHFGWRKNYDPFTGAAPTAIDTVVNYTQRRYLWTDEWFVKNYHVDPLRININGHSMGSRGATMMAKAFPDHFASATMFNNGGPIDEPPSAIDVVYGSAATPFPTNLTDYDGKTVVFHQCPDYNTRLSNRRDLPLMRYFHAKNDTNGSNGWDKELVAQFRAADSLGWGAQLSWSEREHGIDTGKDWNDHWTHGNGPTEQTVVDDVAYEELAFRADVSYPAFFNHRLDPKNNDPGDGTPGTGASGVGDDWGTWGGYHRWENVQEIAAGWQATAWLESGATYGNDNCPENSLLADMAIRRPQVFKPLTGKNLNWVVKDAANGQVLQSGATIVKADNLVVIPQIEVFREAVRKVKITVFDPTVSTSETEGVSKLEVFPNPTDGVLFLKKGVDLVRVFGVGGRVVFEKRGFELYEIDLSGLPAGLYFLETEQGWGRFVKF